MLKHATVTPLDGLLGYYEDGYIVQVPNPGVPLSSLFFLAFYPARTPLILLIHCLMAYPVLKWVC